MKNVLIIIFLTLLLMGLMVLVNSVILGYIQLIDAKDDVHILVRKEIVEEIDCEYLGYRKNILDRGRRYIEVDVFEVYSESDLPTMVGGKMRTLPGYYLEYTVTINDRNIDIVEYIQANTFWR